MLAIHPDILPFHRQGARVARLVERPDDLLEVDAAPARGAEVPAAARIAEVQVAREDARAAVERDDRILHVHVVDAVGERADELHGAHALPVQMARIEVEAEFLTVVERLEGPLGRDEVEGDLRRMHLQREAHAALGEDVEDRIPPLGELREAGLDHRLGHRRERIEERPDRGAGEPVHDRHAEPLGGAGRVLHLLHRTPVDPRGVAIAPDVRRQDRLVAFVDAVADGLADEVAGDRVYGEVMALELLALRRAVARLADRPRHIEVVPPAGQFQSVVAERHPLAGEVVERQVGPLAGEECDGACHRRDSWRGREVPSGAAEFWHIPRAPQRVGRGWQCGHVRTTRRSSHHPHAAMSTLPVQTATGGTTPRLA